MSNLNCFVDYTKTTTTTTMYSPTTRCAAVRQFRDLVSASDSILFRSGRVSLLFSSLFFSSLFLLFGLMNSRRKRLCCCCDIMSGVEYCTALHCVRERRGNQARSKLPAVDWILIRLTDWISLPLRLIIILHTTKLLHIFAASCK